MKIEQSLANAANTLLQDLKAENMSIRMQSDSSAEDSLLDISQFSDSAKQGIALAQSLGLELTPQQATIIGDFIDQAPGSHAEKLMALSVIIDKQLPLDGQIISDVSLARQISLADYIYDEAVPGAKQALPEVKLKLATDAVDSLVEALYSEVDHVNQQMVTTFAKPQEERDERQEALDEEFLTTLRSDVEALADSANDQALAELSALLTSQAGRVEFEQSALQTRVKLVLEETITPKLAEVKAEFEQFKRTCRNELLQLHAGDTLEKPQRVQLLDKLIDKLDNTIMKSEIGLYISMRSERELMKQSSQLSNAKEALGHGQISQAEKIVREVMQKIDQMTFKPTIKKALALANPINLDADQLKYDKIVSWARRHSEQFSSSDKSVASLTHYLRRLGINHESEVFQKVFQQKSSQSQMPQKDITTLKAMLLKMTAQNGEKPEQAEKMLAHLNGQQINLKVTDRPQLQQMMLSIPMSMQGHVSDVKVFIKSDAQALKADWRNFSMFFVLDTKRLGEVGIKVSAVDTNLRIDIHSDRQEAQTVLAPLVDILRKNVETAGFAVTGVNFSRFREHPNQLKTKTKVANRATPYAASRLEGVDFTL